MIRELLLVATVASLGLHAAERPDIVVILADDMGYSDAGCFGGEIPTPALDRLAENGLRLTRCRNAGMCVTSRTSFLTGQWWPSGQREFGKREVLPERLQTHGYRTALIGKWHLPGHPMDHGFDHFFGFLGGFADHFGGSRDYHLDRAPFTAFGKDFYSSDAFAERAVRFVEKTDSEQPLFLYLSFQAPHNPLQAPAADIARHRGNYRQGWQAVREARFARQKKLGVVAPDAELPAAPENLPEWSALSDVQRDLEDLRMATFAAMVERLDRGVGEVVKALQASGRLDNTLIVFLSDNGTDPFSVVDAAMLKQGKLPGDRGSNYQPGLGWAYASVTPWRLYKISQHAGGVTTGAIVHWPKRLAGAGRIDHSEIHFVDLMPTLGAAAGFDAADCDGESFLPLIQGDEWQRKRPMFFQYMDNRAIRTRNWTMAEVDGSGWELFDARKDSLESRDISESRPDIVKQLASQWTAWWSSENQGKTYTPKSTAKSPHYSPQGDRGSGKRYVPSAMPPQPAPEP
ncbi:hypothetical protein HAHE_15450 [Haloferula helveola]|uniref:Sulfatase N-terminal domain-containing protein n=1 Tax=Haloferula helveola TaxID=490095 RepID=A0ABM7RJ43_9BACT|nr:hypothetical protein HAHE_15450 [Haloferula helveola]